MQKKQIRNVLQEKSSKNVITGLFRHVISTSMGLVLPYLLIKELGSESNGLISSVSQLYICLGLLEAGVGTVTLQALYKPVSERNKDSISAILL